MKFSSLKLASLALFSATLASADGHVKVLTSTDFADTIAERTTLVKFYAPWCGHCKAMAPEYEQAAEELKDEDLYIAKVDCTEEQALCGEHGVQGYPTVKLFAKGGHVSDYNKARKADAIVEFMKKQTMPALSDLDEQKFDSWKEEQKVFVVGYTAAPTGPAFTALKEAADNLRNDYLFGVIHDKKLAEKHGVKSLPAIVLYKQFDEKKNQFPQNVDTLVNQKSTDESIYTVEHVTKFVEVNSVPLIDDVSQENYARYMEAGLPLGFIFVSEKEQRTELGPAFEAAAKKHRGKLNLVYIDAKLYGGHAANLNLKEEWPAFGIQELSSGSKFPFPSDKELAGKGEIEKFIDSYIAGELTPDIKSEEVPEDNSAPVKVIVASQFEELVLDKSKDVFIEFYAPWCGHCKRLAPIWDELAEKLVDVSGITIAKMDATANDLPPGLGFTIEGFPTLKLFKAETNEVVDYMGDRELPAFVSFLKENSSADINIEIEEPKEEEEAGEHDDHEGHDHGEL